MAKNLVSGTNIIVEENGDNINMNLSSDYSNSLNNQLTNINNSIITKTTYSTTEAIVGTWIDGKPIYRKVVDLGQIQVTTSEKRYDINIANPDIITSLDIMMKFDNGNIWYRNWHIEELSYKKSNNSILIVGNQTATFEKGYVVLEYTKNTN